MVNGNLSAFCWSFKCGNKKFYVIYTLKLLHIKAREGDQNECNSVQVEVVYDVLPGEDIGTLTEVGDLVWSIPNLIIHLCHSTIVAQEFVIVSP